jgi:hypothetical protein
LLTDFLDDLLTNTPNILQTDTDLHLNLDKIKESPVEELEKEDKIALVLVLLKQLQPYLSASNLSMPKQAPGGGQMDTLNKVLNNINVQTKKGEDQKLPPIGAR